MAKRGITLLPILIAGLSCPCADAALAVDGSGEFEDHVRAALATLAHGTDPIFRQLHEALLSAPGVITFRKMNDDTATWARGGDPDRGHTEPADGRPKREGRGSSTDAIVYIPLNAVQPGSERWRSGLFIHELVHALDLATGSYNPDYRIRERRAVFMQNAWRERSGFPLRASYHGSFPTLDYQYAKSLGITASYFEYIFGRSDFPNPPATGLPK